MTQSGIKYGKEGSGESNMLIGKLMANRKFNKRSIMATIKKGWNIGEDTEIMEMEDNAYIFNFPNSRDK